MGGVGRRGGTLPFFFSPVPLLNMGLGANSFFQEQIPFWKKENLSTTEKSATPCDLKQ